MGGARPCGRLQVVPGPVDACNLTDGRQQDGKVVVLVFYWPVGDGRRPHREDYKCFRVIDTVGAGAQGVTVGTVLPEPGYGEQGRTWVLPPRGLRGATVAAGEFVVGYCEQGRTWDLGCCRPGGYGGLRWPLGSLLSVIVTRPACQNTVIGNNRILAADVRIVRPAS